MISGQWCQRNRSFKNLSKIHKISFKIEGTSDQNLCSSLSEVEKVLNDDRWLKL